VEVICHEPLSGSFDGCSGCVAGCPKATGVALPVAAAASADEPFLSPFPSQAVYFHTSLNHPGIAAVVEVVVTVGKGDGGSRHLSCGFGLIPLFGSGSEAPDPSAEDRA